MSSAAEEEEEGAMASPGGRWRDGVGDTAGTGRGRAGVFVALAWRVVSGLFWLGYFIFFLLPLETDLTSFFFESTDLTS